MAQAKWGIKGFIKLIVFLAILLAIIYGVVRITGVSKMPAPSSLVWHVLTTEGYDPEDITEKYSSQDSGLVKCIGVKKDDISFEFYDFDNNASAVNACGNAHSLIVRTKMGLPRAQTKTAMANYTIYTLKARGEYSVAIHVGNTAIYAYSSEENAEKIAKILTDIGYFNVSNGFLEAAVIILLGLPFVLGLIWIAFRRIKYHLFFTV